MKAVLLAISIVLLVSGCASGPTVCGNAIFFFVEGEKRPISTNFRDDRLLKSDVFLKGTIQEWRPGPQWKAQAFFSYSLELESSAPIENFELSLVVGRDGDEHYIKVPLIRADSFTGRTVLPEFRVGGLGANARLSLSFSEKADRKVREIEIEHLQRRN